MIHSHCTPDFVPYETVYESGIRWTIRLRVAALQGQHGCRFATNRRKTRSTRANVLYRITAYSISARGAEWNEYWDYIPAAHNISMVAAALSLTGYWLLPRTCLWPVCRLDCICSPFPANSFGCRLMVVVVKLYCHLVQV